MNNKTASGFSLIEVLITMLVLAIGLLGIAALQFKGMKYHNDAGIRSNISMVAYDIADKIRLNRDNAVAYLSTSATAYTVGTDKPAIACTQASGANATNDLNCWYHTLFENVPPGTQVGITRSAPTSTGTAPSIENLYTVTITWTDREGSAETIRYAFVP